MAAFPSTSGSVQESLDSAWRRARQVAGDIKQRTTMLNNAAAAGNISSSAILSYATQLADAKVALASVASVSGIGAYAQEQIADPTFDIVTSFNDMVAAVDAVTAWIIANFPKDGDGYLLATLFSPDNNGRTQDRQFTPVQTANLRTALNGLLATIN